MNLNWNALAVVFDHYLTFLLVHGHFDVFHIRIILLVIGSIDQDLVEDLVKSRYVANLTSLHLFCLRVIDPHLLLGTLHGSNVGIWTMYDMLELSHHLIVLRICLGL